MGVLGICGSLRTVSWNKKLLRVALATLENLGNEVKEFDLVGLPMYNWDDEVREGYPEAAVALRDAIQQAEAVVIAAPEFNNSMPAAIKNAIEWASRPPNVLNGKVFFVMGAAPGRLGATRMHVHLSYSLGAEGAWVLPQPRVLLPEIANILGPNGELLDPTVGELLEDAMSRLMETARALGR